MVVRVCYGAVLHFNVVAVAVTTVVLVKVHFVPVNRDVSYGFVSTLIRSVFLVDDGRCGLYEGKVLNEHVFVSRVGFGKVKQRSFGMARMYLVRRVVLLVTAALIYNHRCFLLKIILTFTYGVVHFYLIHNWMIPVA